MSDHATSSGTRSGIGELNALPKDYQLHEYRFESVLGSGGFGLTYLATDTNLNLSVAIKEYLPSDLAVRTDDSSVHPKSNAASDGYRWGLRRFLDEARVLATFHHRNIVRVLRFFEANNTAYMVMEYEAGEALRDWIARLRPLPEPRLLKIADAMLDGLGVIHQANYLHRDIKPGNVIVRADGMPVLLDFGAARLLSGKNDQELTAVVTPGYAPFEQYHSHGRQGPWSDIYSMAAVLYWAVTGHRPIEAAARVKRDTLPPAVSAGDKDTYSLEFLSAIDWGLDPDEDKRPQDVHSFRAALHGEDPAQAQQAVEEPEPVSQRSRSVAIDVSQASPVSASGPLFFPPDLLAKIEEALAHHLGPVATVMVRRGAKRSGDYRAFIMNLANEITDEQARSQFLAAVRPLDKDVSRMTRMTTGQPSSPPSMPSGAILDPSSPVSQSLPKFGADLLAKTEAELALHLGPLARVLVRKAATAARDEAELYLLLSDNIADPVQRKIFIRKSLQAFRK